jgi:acetyl-CoA acetyltransferase
MGAPQICFSSWLAQQLVGRLDCEVAMTEAVIVSSVRTPVGKAFKGSLRATRPDDLAAVAIKDALARVPGLDAKEIDDVILGCAMPEGEQGMNVARIASLRAGLPIETSAMTVNRFCSSGLQAIAIAAERIRAGSAQVIVAGGTESMTMVPMGGNKVRRTSRVSLGLRVSKRISFRWIHTRRRWRRSRRVTSRKKRCRWR